MQKKYLLLTVLCCVHVGAAAYVIYTVGGNSRPAASMSQPYTPSAVRQASPAELPGGGQDLDSVPLSTDEAADGNHEEPVQSAGTAEYSPDFGKTGQAARTDQSRDIGAGSDPATTDDNQNAGLEQAPGTSNPNSDETVEPIPFTARVRTNLHIRRGPSMDAAIIGRIPSGKSGELLALTDDKWAEISYNGLHGYASVSYLAYDSPTRSRQEQTPAEDTGTKPPAPLQEQLLYITGSCYVRSSPDSSNRKNIVATTQKGDTFIRIPENDASGWYAVQLEGQNMAYISASYSEVK